MLPVSLGRINRCQPRKRRRRRPSPLADMVIHHHAISGGNSNRNGGDRTNDGISIYTDFSNQDHQETNNRINNQCTMSVPTRTVTVPFVCPSWRQNENIECRAEPVTSDIYQAMISRKQNKQIAQCDLSKRQRLPNDMRPTIGNGRRTTQSLLLSTLSLCTLVISIGLVSQTDCLQMQLQPSDANLPAEARGDVSPNAYNQLVNLLAGLASQQQQSPRRIPLNNPNLQQRTQLQQATNQQVSTPVNPFAANNGPLQPQYQAPTVSQQQQQRRVNQFQQQPNNLFVSSSPETPYLTLNRIASLANQNNQARPYNQQSPVQPLNTIPLGSTVNQNGPNQRGNMNPIMVPPRAMQPQRNSQPAPNQPFGQPMNNGGGQQRAPISTPLPPFARIPSAVKPLVGGFAPSGPPPSTSGDSSNAMVVVQSPPSTVGGVQPVTEATNKSLAPGASEVTSTSTSASDTVDDKLAQSSTILISSTSLRPDSESSNGSSPASSSTTTTSTPANQQVATSEKKQPSEVTGVPDSRPESDWNPVDGNRSTSGKQPGNNRTVGVSLSPSPDIVTVPPGYNPDNAITPPQNYDIAVSANMGGTGIMLQPTEQNNSTDSTVAAATSTPPLASSKETIAPSRTQQPTAVTTIIWSPPATSEEATASSTPQSVSQKQPPATSVADPRPPVTRIRDSSMLSDEPKEETVYGKSPLRDSKPVAPSPSPVLSQASVETSVAGRPHVQPVQLDNQVRPFTGERSVLKSNHGGPPPRSSRPISSSGSQPLQVGGGFTIMANGNQTMPTGDIQDYVAGQPPFLVPSSGDSDGPTISAQGGPDPGAFELGQPTAVNRSSSASEPSSSPSSSPSPIQPVRVRRPTFKPKLADPPIRIDSCIVGEDSSCEQAHNERCVTEYGISSCHCKPGFARLSQLRGFCQPVSQLQMSFKIDRLSDERKLALNQTLMNSNSEEYQYLEFETIQALAGAFQLTSLAKQYMGARVLGFFERKRPADHKVWANVSLSFEMNNITRNDRILTLVNQELLRVLQASNSQAPKRPLGDSTIVIDGVKESLSALTDVNECANRELNDCHKFATCINDFGAFHCQCQPGYEDKHGQSEDRSKRGRNCLGCSASYCSNRGECFINEGQKQCKCKANFVGSRCDIDSEVLAVAIGGSLVGIVIMIITFWCLFVFNRRWKREQQKMDAMSATSGLTYNYVNSNSTNSLMSPSLMQARQAASHHGPAGLHRSGGHPVSALAANYGQRFGVALVGGRMGGIHHGQQHHYAADQQAIMGSTSSDSSAASQPIGGGLYAPASAYQYEDSGLLIAPASSGSSEQTSPSGNSYAHQGGNASAALMAGNSYTLSGHSHHHHHHHHGHLHHPHQQQKIANLSQFHPAADYRTLNQSQQHCANNGAAYDNRWRTLQQESKQSALMGYYLSPDMLAGHQHQLHQMYASPQQELCIDTGAKSAASRLHQSGRLATGIQHPTMRSRVQPNSRSTRNSAYRQDHEHIYDHERPI